jgi:hypothetical protein
MTSSVNEQRVEWEPIETAPLNQYILVARKSGYVGYLWDYQLGKLQPEYRRYWIDIGGDRIEPQPLYWTALPNPPYDEVSHE